MIIDDDIWDILTTDLSYDTKKDIIKNLLNTDTKVTSINQVFKEIELKNINTKKVAKINNKEKS